MRKLRPKEVKEFISDPTASNEKNQHSLIPTAKPLITMLCCSINHTVGIAGKERICL